MNRMNRFQYRTAGLIGLALLLGTTPGLAGYPAGNDTSDANYNTGGGFNALYFQPYQYGGYHNTAYGSAALFNVTKSFYNTAVGSYALYSTIGGSNTGIGYQSLYYNISGNNNTASGFQALWNSIGNNNTAVGYQAGYKLSNGSDNVYLGNAGAATESKTMRLGGVQTRAFIAGVAKSALSGSTVVIQPSGRLGVVASSARYKKDIADMGEQSRKLFALRPVSFQYKEDDTGQRQYGLIAEEVAKIYPELVVRDEDGTVESVQYHELIPMLLNELQRQQRTLQQLEAENRSLRAAMTDMNRSVMTRLDKLESATQTQLVANQ